jgi:hypothetical protein
MLAIKSVDMCGVRKMPASTRSKHFSASAPGGLEKVLEEVLEEVLAEVLALCKKRPTSVAGQLAVGFDCALQHIWLIDSPRALKS